MKKIIIGLCLFALVVSFGACGETPLQKIISEKKMRVNEINSMQTKLLNDSEQLRSEIKTMNEIGSGIFDKQIDDRLKRIDENHAKSEKLGEEWDKLTNEIIEMEVNPEKFLEKP